MCLSAHTTKWNTRGALRGGKMFSLRSRFFFFFFFFDVLSFFLAPKSPTHEQHFANRCQIMFYSYYWWRLFALVVDLEATPINWFVMCLLNLLIPFSFLFSAKVHKRNLSNELHSHHWGHIPPGHFTFSPSYFDAFNDGYNWLVARARGARVNMIRDKATWHFSDIAKTRNFPRNSFRQ